MQLFELALNVCSALSLVFKQQIISKFNFYRSLGYASIYMGGDNHFFVFFVFFCLGRSRFLKKQKKTKKHKKQKKTKNYKNKKRHKNKEKMQKNIKQKTFLDNLRLLVA